MPEDADSEWTVSDDELTRLTELFCQFEGASDPRTVKCREALKGNRAGQHSIRVNDQWRVCFRWKGKDAHDVEIVDYH